MNSLMKVMSLSNRTKTSYLWHTGNPSSVLRLMNASKTYITKKIKTAQGDNWPKKEILGYD